MKNVILTLGLTLYFLSGFSQEMGTLTDPRDGKVYKTVKIGTQWIMAENLAYMPKYVEPKDTNFVIQNGFLYCFKDTKTISIPGWHIPTSSEWKKVYKFLGNHPKTVYSAMIEGGSSGFNALLLGVGNGFNFVVNKGTWAGYWSSSRFGLGYIGILLIASPNSAVGSATIGVINANLLNVRLFKD